ncbi:M24B family metallopeptidase [Fastidiosibacter lacustris]|uniref:M24B family metallopeptidase n=1 Tax=Fastidiosibacter lacustris TaxID=2056695 RepID=UPI00130056B9|nr:M24B family metallopeptidase [Fastidiosibacter lacustris]
MHWLTENWRQGITEIEAADKLKNLRLQMPNALDLSFETKSAFGSNGAVIHYDPTPETNKTIADSSLYLFDSGTQYLESTTDVTRTIHLGKPTARQKQHYTLVLKGHLALGRAKFPKGTCGEHLDAFARMYLWEEGLDYQHGTGHGVGSSLCVHEGPQKISKAPSGVPLQPGMIVSNEPGLYIEGEYGIRIENLCLVAEVKHEKKEQNFTSEPFYCFETLTLMPYCKKLIATELLTEEEKRQIINYYQEIENKVMHLLDIGGQVWLKNELCTDFLFQATHHKLYTEEASLS